MKDELEKALKVILAKIRAETPSHELLHLTQSALNLAHTGLTLKG